MSAPAETVIPADPERSSAPRPPLPPRFTLAWSVVRLLVAVILIAGVTQSLLGTISGAVNVSRQLGHFFSYFTMWSNLLAIAMLVSAAAWTLATPRSITRRSPPIWIAVGLAAAVTCMSVTGVVYNALLRPERSELASFDWSNEVLHVVGPVFMVVDLVVAPGIRRLPWRAIWAILTVPIVWTIYTLVRGWLLIDPATGRGWYPYFFIDPDMVAGGWWGVTVFLLVITVVVAAIATAVVAVVRRRTRISSAPSRAAAGPNRAHRATSGR